MSKSTFNYALSDAQATAVNPVSPKAFAYARFADSEQQKLAACRAFAQASSGVLVCRRMRVGEVFRDACRDDALSLSLQLGALEKSLDYASDVPAFLEPWFGIGTIAASYGAQYHHGPDQAPAVKPMFDGCKKALSKENVSVADTDIGRKILRQMTYFLDATDGRLPLSPTDLQSPLNTACQLVDIMSFFMDCLDEPETAKALLDNIADRTVEFSQVQRQVLGASMALPGHGFSSCRAFGSLGLSDDNIVMISSKLYEQIALPAFARCAEGFGGLGFHSCGNWTDKISTVAKIPGLLYIDGAFTPETDPGANPDSAPFGEAFANTGITVNLRLLGSIDTVIEKVRQTWRPGLKLIVVTYCQTPQEQKQAYQEIHAICQ